MLEGRERVSPCVVTRRDDVSSLERRSHHFVSEKNEASSIIVSPSFHWELELRRRARVVHSLENTQFLFDHNVS